MNSPSILIIEDDKKMREALSQIMTREKYSVEKVSSGEAALKLLKDNKFDLIISDLKLPGIDGMEVLKAIRKYEPDTSVIIITAFATIDSAVQAIKQGAENYISKPFNIDEIRLVVKKVFERRTLLLHNMLLQSQLSKKYKFENMIGNSEKMIDVFKVIEKVKDSKSTILIGGETGTGKELVARAIHYNSVRSDKFFLPVNCGAMNENLLESEFFGYVKGSFTGAQKDKHGIFEVADGGSIFLDEIGDVSMGLQQVLLRVLENGEIQPVGSPERKKVNVRIIAATNKNLEEMTKQNKFREDLFYRVNVIKIDLPPLRERKEDIALLIHHFLIKYSKENNKTFNRGINKEALKLLEAYNWPGNVRELENVIERASLLETGDDISSESLPEQIRNYDSKTILQTTSVQKEKNSLEQIEKEHILKVLKQVGGNKKKASNLLGINRTTLWRLIQKYGISDNEI